MSVSDHDDLVSSIEGGATSSANAVIALHADDDDLSVSWNQISQLSSGERVAFLFVDHEFVRKGREVELPARGIWLVWIARFPAIANMYDSGWVLF